MRYLAILSLLCVPLFPGRIEPQSPDGFDLEAYQRFLDDHVDLTPEGLAGLYPGGVFADRAPMDFSKAAYSDSIDAYYQLTEYEKELVRRHGFAVTERVRFPSFGGAFQDIYSKDLPVFVSTDAILHALHMSYDKILIALELQMLRPRLLSLLERLHRSLPALDTRYAGEPRLKPALRDLDVYLTIPRQLLGQQIPPLYPENKATVEELLGYIAAQQAVDYPLFGTSRSIDFSQFTVRGHYTDMEELGQHFKAMMWLGRTEFYLGAPEGVVVNLPEPEDIQRQTLGVALLAELARESETYPLLEEIDSVIRGLVGDSDNLTLPQAQAALEEMQIEGVSQLLEEEVLREFQERAGAKAQQLILSQILLKEGLMSPVDLKPAPAFLLLGQRFILDSYFTANVVFDKIKYQGEPIFRGLPSTLDVLFALGNDAALQLLEGELSQYHYASNLAALRYLVDSIEPGFWGSTLHSGWLNAIRTLNPPAERSGLPPFMQTAAWWQEKMNTQLASWAQLRHDHLLYAKSSYTGGTTCSFPEVYVEPIPPFYRAVAAFARQAAEHFARVPLWDVGMGGNAVDYFNNMAAVCDNLAAIAQKELDRTPLDEAEAKFLKCVLSIESGECVTVYNGWYPGLYYNANDSIEQNLVVADVHTQPTDEVGNMVGNVLHVGTGLPDLAIVVAELPERKQVAFVGPVMSYYEHVSLNFKRLTDEEWEKVYAEPPSFRPDFTRLYLAGREGETTGYGPMLATAVEEDREASLRPLPEDIALAPNFPNPFNAGTFLRFSIGTALAQERVELAIYNLQGQRVRTLVDQSLAAGHYSVRWDGTGENGAPVASGVYSYRLKVGEQEWSDKMSLVR